MQGTSSEFEPLVLDESPDAVIVTTTEGDVLCWNRGAECLLGCGAAEALGRALSVLVALPDRVAEERRFLQEKQLRTIHASAHHLLSLINDLVDLAKVESGKIEIHREPTSCAEVIEQVAATVWPPAEKKGLALKLVLPKARMTRDA